LVVNRLRRTRASRALGAAPARSAARATVSRADSRDERRRVVLIGKINDVKKRLSEVLPVALQFAAVHDDSFMNTKLIALQRLVDGFEAERDRNVSVAVLRSFLRKIEGGVLDVKNSLDRMCRGSSAARS